MRYILKQFYHLIGIFFVIIIFAITRQLYNGSWTLLNAMTDFMAAYFILFGAFKLITLHRFAKLYRQYDLLAQYNQIYANLYPCIEITIGALYLYRMLPTITNGVAFLIMLTNSISVAIALNTADKLTCACLGTLLPTPLTYVTLLKNILITSMAFGMFLFFLL